MNEAQLKSALGVACAEVMPGCVYQRHENRPGIRKGQPDASVVWGGATTWLEVKYANPKCKVYDIQVVECRRLARQGECLFVVYQEATRTRERETFLVHPEDIVFPERWTRKAQGFDHRWVASMIKEGREAFIGAHVTPELKKIIQDTAYEKGMSVSLYVYKFLEKGHPETSAPQEAAPQGV